MCFLIFKYTPLQTRKYTQSTSNHHFRPPLQAVQLRFLFALAIFVILYFSSFFCLKMVNPRRPAFPVYTDPRVGRPTNRRRRQSVDRQPNPFILPIGQENEAPNGQNQPRAHRTRCGAPRRRPLGNISVNIPVPARMPNGKFC